MANRYPPDPAYNQLARASAGSALGAVVAGLPVLWGQIGPPVILSAGLATYWTFIVGLTLRKYPERGRVLLLGAPFAWLWSAVAAWVLWG